MKKTLVLAVTAVASFLYTGTASASCAEIPPLERAVEEAPILFVGTVTDTTNADRWATVTVEEVWKGKGIGRAVEVRAGPKDPPGPLMSASSVDRTYQEGVRYLFFPYRARRGTTLSDSSCSSTTRFTSALERYRPASAHEPGPGGNDPDPGSPFEQDDALQRPWWVAAVLLLGFGGISVLVLSISRARRRAAEGG